MPLPSKPAAGFAAPYWLVCAGVLAVYACRLAGWMSAELWYDEVVSLTDFVLGPPGRSLLDVFRHYPVANNHVLFSALAWIWVRACPLPLTEWTLRLLPFACGLLTVWLICAGWWRWLGRRMALLAGLLFAISPVFAAFAYQFRGYSLSMLLSALLLSGNMELVYGCRRRGLWLSCLSAGLLPVVIPANALVVAGQVVFLALAGVRRGFWPRVWRNALPVGLAGGTGLAYYLSIWPQFRRVLAQTSGWDSAPAVLGNLVLAMAAHLGPLLVLFGVLCLSMLPACSRQAAVLARVTEAPGEKRFGVAEAWTLLAASLLPAVLVLLVLRPVPYPRVFLVCLPVWSFAVAALVRSLACLARLPARLLAVAFLLNGVMWERGSDWLTQRQMAKGEYSQNLLQQYYRNARDLSTIAARLTDAAASDPQRVVLSNFHDFVALRYYLLLRGFPPAQILGVGQSLSARFQHDYAGAGWTWVVVATSPENAEKMVRERPGRGRLSLLWTTPNRFVYAMENP
jgi:hypothetical protein